MDVTQIAARLKAANEAYRNGTPIMTDAVYDSLEDQLRLLDPNHIHFKGIGAAPSSAWVKVQHSIPMGSLNKAQNEAEAKAWWPQHPTCITHKLDGISCSMKYENGVLVAALTRGDGDTGEDITRNVILMEGAVKKIPVKGTVFVRGEIICRKRNFATHFPGEANTRNTAAGTAKRQTDNSKCKFLTVVAYQFLPDGVPLPTKSEEIVTLTSLGFVVPQVHFCKSFAEGMAVYQSYVGGARAALDWDIDGLVIEIDDRDARERLGSHNQRPKGAIALKFPHEQGVSTLNAIRWQVGPSGRITPVAEFSPVPLAGAVIKQASLHNMGHIQALAAEHGRRGLAKGDKITISRRNDVIPFVESVVVPNPNVGVLAFNHPKFCPECSAGVKVVGAYLVCPNSDLCSAQVSGAIKRWLNKIGVLHFGDALVDLLCESGKVETIADLYTLDPDEIAKMTMGNRQVGGTAAKAFANLHANTTMPLGMFVGSLGIPFVGRTVAQTIVDAGYDTLLKMARAKVEDLAAISGVGQIRAQAFCVGFWELLDRGVITNLRQYITLASKPVGAFTGLTVCMTGFRDKQMETAIEAQGGTLKSSVSQALDILVAKDPNSTSGKAQQAAKFGVEVIGIDDMWVRLGGKP